MGTQRECEQVENSSRSANVAEFRAEPAGRPAAAVLSIGASCSICPPDWLPKGH